LVSVGSRAGAGRIPSESRRPFELFWSFELTMLAALGAEVLMLARCAVGGGCGAIGWRS
jgi:hypothetical protein